MQRRTLNPISLTVFMVVLIFAPISFGLFLYSISNPLPEPLLPALVKLDTMWIEGGGQNASRRLVPCIAIRNPTTEDWRNLSVGLNEQFFCQEPKGVPAGEVVALPLEVFVARNGSVRFPVGNREIKRATVFAQIPSGARAVSEHAFLLANPKRGDSNEADWIAGVTKSEFLQQQQSKRGSE